MSLEQKRRLVTELPGPRSRQLMDRKPAAVDERPGDVPGRGAMLELVRSRASEPDPRPARDIARYAHQRGVIVLTCGTYGNVLPPVPISGEPPDDAFDELIAAFEEIR